MDGRELRRIRWKLNLTQVEFAKELGITSNALARLERGERSISLTLAKLARILEASYGLR